ncbi:MAG: DUF1688 family protein [Polyangiaceae bacterium]
MHAALDLTGTTHDVAFLRSPGAIRERCGALLERARARRSENFEVNDARADRVVEAVRAVFDPRPARRHHGRLGHFQAGGRDRAAELEARLASRSALDRARAKFDLVVTSVLLDAGAGAAWRYVDRGGEVLGRSEGLAVASFELFMAGGFSSDGASLRADAAGLSRLTPERLAAALQVSPENPLIGLEGRAKLLAALGRALRARPDLFGEDARPAGLIDAFRLANTSRLTATSLLAALLEGFASIWPRGLRLFGANLGDAWIHPALGAGAKGVVPFHKLSQWLAWSLVEPLADAGLEVVDRAALTPLADYRNGGLLIDTGVLVLRRAAPDATLSPADPLVIEWRALTVAWLDEARGALTRELGPSCCPARLEQATWLAGRSLAAARRPFAASPLDVASDGTVF